MGDIVSHPDSPVLGSELAPPPPPWFTKKKRPPPIPARQKSLEPREKPVPIALAVAPLEASLLLWPQRVKTWILGAPGVSLGVAVLSHIVLIGALAMIVLQGEPEDVLLSVFSYESEQVSPEDYVEIGDIDTTFNEGGDHSAQEATIPSIVEAKSDLSLPKVDVNLKSGLTSKDGTGQGEGDNGKGVTLTPGKNAVRKGSFTAWTLPADPDPGMDYTIYIKVDVPDGLSKYPMRDLMGSFVRGTDGYMQMIPDPRLMKHNTIVRKGEVVLEVYVPGAARLVKDTISIQSKVLKEKQTLEIVF